jgi:hypothetical protein
MVVRYKISNIQTDSNMLWTGHKNDETMFRLGAGDARLTRSTDLATNRRTDSGSPPRLPGGYANGSCRCHQAVSTCVCDNRRTYACRDSAAAAHSNGIAASPRGVL